jgi:hypothetical protein
MKRIPLLIAILFYLFTSLWAMEIKPLQEIALDHGNEIFIRRPGSFIVTNDDLFFIFDSKASDIKIYNTAGKLKRVFGRSGMGPDEFLKPYLSAYKEPFILIGDYGRKSLFIYKRIDGDNLVFVKKFLFLDMGNDIHLIDPNKILVSGYKQDRSGKAYNLYEFDAIKNEYNFILNSENSYGFDSSKKYQKEFADRLRYIGLLQYTDYSKDSIYLAWTGDTVIIKVNRKTKTFVSFGHKTANFVKPKLTPEIKRAYDERKHMIIYELRKPMSYVRDLFVLSSGNVGLVYFGPYEPKTGMAVWLQLYKGNGEFLKELKVMDAKSPFHYDMFSYFRKDKNLLYILDVETTESFDQFHTLYEFRIVE